MNTEEAKAVVEEAKAVLARAEMLEANVERTRRAIEEYFGLPTELADRIRSDDNCTEYFYFVVKSPTGKNVLKFHMGWRADCTSCDLVGTMGNFGRGLKSTFEQIWESTGD